MYCGETAPWDHFTKNLRIGEFLDPLQVVVEFFSTGLPPEQLKKLEQWQYFVVNEEYYNDQQIGPGRLLLIYDLHLRVMEAAYLLLLKFGDSGIVPKPVTSEQIDIERQTWAYFPKDLSIEELSDPYSLVAQCFDQFAPQAYRDHLHAWLRVALSAHTDFETLLPSEIISFYENMQRLCKGAWLIRQREAGDSVLKS
jgi:hypothetical protein